jgi:tetratricopeptide (TPR) repeat protein
MKNMKGTIIGFMVFILIVFAGMGASFLHQRNLRRAEFADHIISHWRWVRPDSVAELRAAIAANERRIERHVEYAARTGTYWKLLAVRLQQRGLHGETLEALERAIFYTPEDPMLHYYTGISAAVMAKSFHVFPGRDTTERDSYFNLAERAFLRAIELDANYLRPRYSLGVLYVFDLDRPEEAIPHLLLCLEVSRNDIDTMFVLARAYFMLRRFRDAVDLYDRIIVLTGDEQRRIDARQNRQIAMDHIHG